VLYIEQPAGVGFSYFTNKDDISFNFTDYNAAQDNLEAVLGWYEKFPEFKTNDLYVSGESYAGVYVPYLVYLMNNHIEANINNPEAFLPPLKGMMVGNGVTNWAYDTDPGAFEMSYWHTLVDKAMYDNKTANNCTFNNMEDEDDVSDICKEIQG
jgi:serine carboxypeptidase-like clade 2